VHDLPTGVFPGKRVTNLRPHTLGARPPIGGFIGELLMQKIRLTTLAFAAISVFGGKASASLISLGAIPSSGNGIGAVNTSTTFQNIGSESGCVAFDGAAATTGASSCPSGFTGGDEKPGSSQNNVFTAADLGFTATINFANLVILFNGN